jgi:hypothetical protein
MLNMSLSLARSRNYRSVTLPNELTAQNGATISGCTKIAKQPNPGDRLGSYCSFPQIYVPDALKSVQK